MTRRLTEDSISAIGLKCSTRGIAEYFRKKGNMLKLLLERFGHKRSSTKLASIYKCSELKNEYRFRNFFRLPLAHVGVVNTRKTQRTTFHSIVARKQAEKTTIFRRLQTSAMEDADLDVMTEPR